MATGISVSIVTSSHNARHLPNVGVTQQENLSAIQLNPGLENGGNSERIDTNGRVKVSNHDKSALDMSIQVLTSMQLTHVVRFGTLGHVGRFSSRDHDPFPRGHRVVVQTGRGIETGEVLTLEETHQADDSSLDGTLLRAMTVEDELLDARLQQNRLTAIEQCSARITELELPVSLIDVEPLFDGQALVFYFLGEETPEVELLVAELTETYETEVQFRRFAQAVEDGCGPDCGTSAAGGCGSCADGGCSLAKACNNGSR